MLFSGCWTIIKGGTCLRKCYFPDYRFSEDLDFSTLSDDFVLSPDVLAKTGEMLRDQTGILTEQGEIKSLVSNNAPKGIQVKIKYWGADHEKAQNPFPSDNWPSLKLEISTDELILLPEHAQRMHHDYPDELAGVEHIRCHDLREVVSEKLRSLVQRRYTAPRDFYDIHYLTQDYNGAQWDEIKGYFLRKMEHKRIAFEGADQLVYEVSAGKVRKAWKASLGHQILQSCDMEDVIKYVHIKMHEIF